MLLQLLGVPNGAAHGDYAFSENDMSRIMEQLAEQNNASAVPPAPQSVIDSLPKVTAKEKEDIAGDQECVVCRDTLINEENDELVKLPCKHIYHFDCVKRWLEAHDVTIILVFSYQNVELILLYSHVPSVVIPLRLKNNEPLKLSNLRTHQTDLQGRDSSRHHKEELEEALVWRILLPTS
jgi:hypothetical protein